MALNDSSQDTVFAEGVWVHETEKAILVEFTVGGKVWLPKSQLRRETEIVDTETQDAVVFIPRWLAENKGIRYEDMPEDDQAEDTDEDVYARMMGDSPME